MKRKKKEEAGEREREREGEKQDVASPRARPIISQQGPDLW